MWVGGESSVRVGARPTLSRRAGRELGGDEREREPEHSEHGGAGQWEPEARSD